PGMNSVLTHGVELLASAHNDWAGSARHLRVMRSDMGSQCLIGVVERLARLDGQPQALVFRDEIPEDIMPGHRSLAIIWLAPVQFFHQGGQLPAECGAKHVEVYFEFTILSRDLLQYHCGYRNGAIVNRFSRDARFIPSFCNAHKLLTISLLFFEITPAPF